MKAILQKINANPFDKADSIQFRVEGDEVDEDLLQIRRGDKVQIKVSSLQTSMQADENGVIISPNEIEFESGPISISICVGTEELIATITVCTENKDIASQILNKNLRGMAVEVLFLPY